MTGWVNPIRDWASRRFGVGTQTFVVGLACGLAWSSHILLDWLGADANPPYGVQAFWPFSDTWFISGVDVFPGTERRNPLSASAMLDQSSGGDLGNSADGIDGGGRVVASTQCRAAGHEAEAR